MASFTDTLNQVSNTVNNISQTLGTLTGGTPILNSSDNNLPSNQVQNFRTGTMQRNIIHWFVPQFGVVQMYVNPSNITYRNKKLITKERTKGGYILQYWGEELTALAITGTTGSSGIEGINVLEEVYRAEQLSFDAIGQSLSASSAATGAAAQIVSGIGSNIANGGGLGSGIASGLFGSNTFTSLAPRNIPSLAELAFGVEMFYNGWIYRGFFEDFQVVESAQNLGLFEYTINFTSTQRRGFRLNEFAWQRSAINGPSNNQEMGGVPLSYLKLDSQ